MNKKYIIIAISIIVIIAIVFGIYKITSSYLFKDKTEITDSKSELINHIKNIDNDEERRNQIDYSIEQNLITQQEANELY